MKFTLLPIALLLPAMCSGQIPQKSRYYLQLLSTRYAVGQPLPADFHRPALSFPFVERAKLPADANVLSAARTKRGLVWVVTDRGVFRSQGAQYVPLTVPRVSDATHLPLPPDTRITDVTDDSEGHIWAATTHGLFITDGGDWWSRLDRQDGMPFEDMTCVHLAANGDVWGGTEQGAWRLRSGKFRTFWGKRWLPGNRVTALWTDAKGRAWAETDDGLACIEERPMTLAEKAAHFDRITQQRHNRRGYIGHIHLFVPGDPTKGAHYEAADSDGLWTGYYVAAMSLRYASTRDPAARRQAQQSMNAMLELERLTGIPGYPARSVATEDEIRAGIKGYHPEQTVRVPGETDKYWVRSPVDKNVWCKSDTSSDTMDGHYFAWYLYSEHVANAAEKKKIAAVARRATDHIMKNGYTLVGHTGRKTRWGVWGPQFLNNDPAWFEQRGLNSLELLSHLKVAHHLTGDPKYARAYDELIEKHHYLQNTLLVRRGPLGDWWNINHSDDQLSYIAYYPLLMLEKAPARRRILTEGLARTWEESASGEQPLIRELSSFYNFAYGAMTANPCAPEDGIADLQDWPWDMVDWTVANSHRHDIQIRKPPEERFRDLMQSNRVLSSAERHLKRWNASPWKANGGSDGRLEHDGSTWLIGYWLGVYHGYIRKDQ